MGPDHQTSSPIVEKAHATNVVNKYIVACVAALGNIGYTEKKEVHESKKIVQRAAPTLPLPYLEGNKMPHCS